MHGADSLSALVRRLFPQINRLSSPNVNISPPSHLPPHTIINYYHMIENKEGFVINVMSVLLMGVLLPEGNHTIFVEIHS
jgi:hypothetical protein